MIFDLKSDCDINDLKYMEPALLILFTNAILYCQTNRLPFKVTSIKSDRENVKSISKTHEQNRAVDISVLGWTSQHIHRFVFMINRDYADIAALSYKDNEPRAAVYHDYENQGSHIHLQVRPNANLDKYVEL